MFRRLISVPFSIRIFPPLFILISIAEIDRRSSHRNIDEFSTSIIYQSVNIIFNKSHNITCPERFLLVISQEQSARSLQRIPDLL